MNLSNGYLLTAGVLAILLGLAHSILGEILIFNSKRQQGNIVPTKVFTIDQEKHLRIIWASWHTLSVFGWCLGAILIKVSMVAANGDSSVLDFLIKSIAYSMFASSFLVLYGTKGRHPGWIVLLAIGILLRAA